MVLGLVIGGMFYQQDGTLQGIQSRTALLYLTTALRPYLILLFATQQFSQGIEY